MAGRLAKKWSETAMQLRPYKPEGFTYEHIMAAMVPIRQ